MKLDEIGIARLIYDAYPSSDMLPIDPGEACVSLQTLYEYVLANDIGDGLFRWIVVEICETVDDELDLDQMFEEVLRVLDAGVGDIEAVSGAVGSARRKLEQADGGS